MMISFYLTTLINIFLLLSNLAQASTPPIEVQALQALYNSAGGPNWVWHNTSEFVRIWNFDANNDPCLDHWQGVFCFQQMNATRVAAIQLTLYNLTGTIPLSISNLYHLNVLELSLNNLHGTIPLSVWQLANLTILDLSFNQFSGHFIPEDDLPAMNAIQILDLYFNHLNGSIPESIGRLSHLSYLDLSHNNLTGQIPDELGTISRIESVYLSNNNLSGTIPSTLFKAQTLKYLSLYFNGLAGPLPPTLAELSGLDTFDVAHNRLTGMLPSALGQLTSLFYLGLANNRFKGTLPVEWSSFSSLSYLLLSNNALTGAIPAEYSLLTNLSTLKLADNRFRGVLPHFLHTLPELRVLDLSNNSFTGSIPDEVYSTTSLIQLSLRKNFLTGSISAGISGMNKLLYFELDDNELTGTLPREIALLPNITQLTLSNNNLKGSLEGIFNVNLQKQLRVVFLNGNYFTGTISGEIFKLARLVDFVAASNCFHGNLPFSDICQAEQLNTLVLDGLSSACKEPVLPLINPGAYVLKRSVKGSLPACLLQLPSLLTLHLSGNEFSGSLSGDVLPSPSLVYLSLSHNALTGTIPKGIQEKQWKQLDLSYNRFSGSVLSSISTASLNGTTAAVKQAVKNYVSLFLQDIFDYFQVRRHPIDVNLLAVTVSEVEEYLSQRFESAGSVQQFDEVDQILYLQNNRLSGKIPAVLRDRANLSILGTNLFACNRYHHDLPRNDSSSARYKCGSQSFETYYYLWPIMITSAAIAVCFAVYFDAKGACYKEPRRWYCFFKQRLKIVEGVPLAGSKTGNYSLATIAVVNKLLDVITRLTWVSLMFSLVVILPTYASLSVVYSSYTHVYAYFVSSAFLSGIVPAVVELTLLLISLTMVVLGFRYLRESLGQGDSVQLEQVIVEKVLGVDSTANAWASMLIMLIFTIINVTVVVCVNLAFVYLSLRYDADVLAAAQLALSVFKLAWNRGLSLRLLRFTYHHIYRVFGIDREFTEFNFVTLLMVSAIINNIAIPLAVIALNSPSCFSALFKHSGAERVTATFLREFCIAFAYDEDRCIVYGVVPESSSYSPPFQYDFQCSSSLLRSYSPAFISSCIISTFVLPIKDYVLFWLHQRATSGSYWYVKIESLLPRLLKPVRASDAAAEQMMNTKSASCAHINRLVINLLSQFATLLTFGAAFPPVAVAVAVSIFATIYEAKFRIGNFLHSAIEQELFYFVHVVEIECNELGPLAILLRKTLWVLMLVKCSFSALFAFDMLGDQVGFQVALWVLVVVPFLPIVIAAVPAVYQRIVAMLSSQEMVDARKRGSSTPSTPVFLSRDMELRDFSLAGLEPNDRFTAVESPLSAMHEKDVL